MADPTTQNRRTNAQNAPQKSASGLPQPRISVVIATYGRGGSIEDAIRTVLANDYPDFELFVVDQNSDDQTAQVVAPFLSDTRLHYMHDPALRGLTRARNAAVAAATGELVLITDDDCMVPSDWLARFSQIFFLPGNERVVVAFCAVDAAPHDPKEGFVPAYHCRENGLISGIGQKNQARGIGAGMAVRRKDFLQLGGFDTMLGAGSPFHACEDGDLAVRALLRGYHVYETNTVAVIHSGFRTYEQGKQLTRRDWYGIGAAYAKPLRCGYWRFLSVPAYELFANAVLPPIRDIVQFKRPRGAMRIMSFLRGFAAGWRAPVDPTTLRFVDERQG